MAFDRRYIFAVLAFVAVVYVWNKYKHRKAANKYVESDKSKKKHTDMDSGPTVTTKFNTKIIPLKPPRNDSYSKALSTHYKFNYSHPQYDAKHDTFNNQFKVITFNVLANCYALINRSYSTYCSSQHLKAEYRFTKIAKILLKCDGDIICLQEVDDKDKTLLLLDLENNHKYKVYYAKKSNKKQDGLVIAYKIRKYQQYDTAGISVIKLNDLSLGCASVNSQQYFAKDQIAIYILLQPIRDPSHLLFICNTHLYYRPNANDIRLRQIAYILNVIHKKYTEIKMENKYNKISLIFCGDFNTLPDTYPINEFLFNGKYIMRAQGNSPLQLIMDSALDKVARWCRSLGVDCASFSAQKLDTENANKLFKICEDENRILITRSKRLVQRKNCPKHFLLNNDFARDNLKQIIKYFDIKYDDNAIFTRCTLCNAYFKELNVMDDAKEIYENDQIPQKLKVKAVEHTFWKCLNCSQVYWFGEKSQREVAKFKIIFAETLLEIDKEEKENKEILMKRLRKQKVSDICNVNDKLKLLPNLQRFFWENVVFVNPFGNRIKCSYRCIYGESPEYTNKTNVFKGCLDYIFYADLINDENVNIKSVKSQLVEGDKTNYPNSTWPSDHILLMSTFKIQ